jgi:hypothetical protein
MRINKYYLINFFLHALYGVMWLRSGVAEFGDYGPFLSDLLLIIWLIVSIPAPIITNIVCMVKLMKKNPDNSGLQGLICLGVAVLGAFFGIMLVGVGLILLGSIRGSI